MHTSKHFFRVGGAALHRWTMEGDGEGNLKVCFVQVDGGITRQGEHSSVIRAGPSKTVS